MKALVVKSYMKNIFIVNPAAGKKNCVENVENFIKQSGIEGEIYLTAHPGDATEYVRSICKQLDEMQNPKKVCFVACGGDGTLNEVVNGAALCKNAQVAVYPCGSGNDYIKYYGGKDSFFRCVGDENSQGTSVDLMKVSSVDGERYSINVCNFGFDTKVVEVMNKVRRIKFLGGKTAYIIGVIVAVFCAMKTKCKVVVDGETLVGGGKDGNSMTLCTVANGRYIGGQYMCAPNSLNNDGLLEVCYVKPISIFTLIRLIGVYAKGEHLNDKRFEKYIIYRQAKSVHIEAGEDFKLCIDGELADGRDFDINVVPTGIDFCVPCELSSAKEIATL